MKKGKKKGPSAQTEKPASRIDRELWFFGENKLALWQPVLYFNPHSPYSNTGDLLILRILEGYECAQREQQPNLTLNPDSMAQIAERYATQLSQQLNLQLKFHRVKSAEARYLLHTSAELIADENRARPLTDFLRFINPEPTENPFEKIPEAPTSEVLTIDFILREAYFAHWMINPHSVENFLDQFNQLEKGPIILTGGPLIARQQEIRDEALRHIFNAKERSLWAYAFKKAAFYLKDSNSVLSGVCVHYAKQLEDLNIPAESLDIARALFERAVQIAQTQQKAREEEERKSSLIVTPDQLRRNPKS